MTRNQSTSASEFDTRAGQLSYSPVFSLGAVFAFKPHLAASVSDCLSLSIDLKDKTPCFFSTILLARFDMRLE